MGKNGADGLTAGPVSILEKNASKKPAQDFGESDGSASRRATSSTEEPIIANRGRSLTLPQEKPSPFAQFQGPPRLPEEDLMNFHRLRYQMTSTDASGNFAFLTSSLELQTMAIGAIRVI